VNKVPEIFNRKKVQRHRQRASIVISEHDFLINEVAGRVLERLDDISREFESILNIGAIGNISELLNRKSETKLLVNQDLSDGMLQKSSGLKVVADEEKIPFANGSFDLVISNLCLHWVNDLPGALVQIRQLLKPDGLFIASMYGLDTLTELRQVMAEVEVAKLDGISPRVSPFTDVKTLGALAQRVGFALPVADSEVIKVSYNNIIELMHDLRGMGEANALCKSGRPLNRSLIAEMDAVYKQKFSDGENGIVATFNVINITGLAAESNK
jgi:NADH dehydrogenase [ubiquinone] 1 alpha subcomplex assembly factor 5